MRQGDLKDSMVHEIQLSTPWNSFQVQSSKDATAQENLDEDEADCQIALEYDDVNDREIPDIAQNPIMQYELPGDQNIFN